MPSLPPRIVTVLVPVQLCCLWLGFAICRRIMRLMEQSDELRMRFPHLPLPVWLFHHTPLLFFLLPLSWGAIACLRAENAGRLMLVQPWDGRLGLGLTAVL